MLAAFPLLLLLGLFLPGFFVAKWLRHRFWWASAFTISLVVLFHSVFWLGVFHIPIQLSTVVPFLLAVTAVAAWFERRSAIPDRRTGIRNSEFRWPFPELAIDRILVGAVACVAAALMARSAISPLIGPDTAFRWDFLAQRLFATGKFDFYPPLAPSDFRNYFYVDGIPPLVSFTHWWLYASAGRYLPSLICFFVAAQFIATLTFTYGTASVLFSRRAGVLAATMLAGCPLYFRSVALGQETGLTALSIAAMLYFLVAVEQEGDHAAMVAAGLAAGLCALAREYGWIAVLAGVLVIVWKRQRFKEILAFVTAAILVAGPWYIRNWIVAGNPFYSLRFGPFALNPIHDAIMQHYNALLGVGHWTGATWAAVVWLLFTLAPLQILLGVPGGLFRFRQQGYLLLIVLLLAVVWIASVGYTSGGIETSTRVLSAALVVLSVMGAGILQSFTETPRLDRALAALLMASLVWTAAHGALYPNNPLSTPLKDWRRLSFQPVSAPLEFWISDQVAAILPPKSRVLSDSAYLHAALLDKGIEVAPVWSPEVRFIFSSSPEDVERKLRSLGIRSVAYYPQSLNTSYLVSASPFYASLLQRWHVLAQAGDLVEILVP
jgi:hypothetical protein